MRQAYYRMRLAGRFQTVAVTRDADRYRIHSLDDDANLLVDATEAVLMHMVDRGDLYEPMPEGGT